MRARTREPCILYIHTQPRVAELVQRERESLREGQPARRERSALSRVSEHEGKRARARARATRREHAVGQTSADRCLNGSEMFPASLPPPVRTRLRAAELSLPLEQRGPLEPAVTELDTCGGVSTLVA